MIPGAFELIREGKTPLINDIIQAGKTEGMKTMDDGIMSTLQSGKVRAEEAYSVASDKKRFEAMLKPAE